MEEKKGGAPFEISESIDFNDFICNNSLLDVGFSGSSYTWCNNRKGKSRIWKRLDRVLINQHWIDLGLSTSVTHLSRVGSDHAPLLVQHATHIKPKCSFRFQNFWTAHEDFLGEVTHIWNSSFTGPSMVVLGKKLKALKKHLKDWSWECFGNIFSEEALAEEEMKAMEVVLDNDPTSENIQKLNQLRTKHAKYVNHVALYWRQKSAFKWLKEGDCNSKLFHQSVKINRSSLRIHRIQNSVGNWLENPKEIAEAGVSYFHELLTDQLTYDVAYWNHLNMELQCCIPKMVTTSDNEMLQTIPDKEEIHQAVFSLNFESAAGPDGFSGHFFQVCSDIIESDIINAVQDFFLGAEIPMSFSASLISLIPKTRNPRSFSDFRPISLCNFSNKILSKILATRLESILQRIILKNQSGFIKGRLITDNILLAEELMSSINKKCRGSNVVIKLDMAKAFDRVSWPYLMAIQRALGFGEKWIDWI